MNKSEVFLNQLHETFQFYVTNIYEGKVILKKENEFLAVLKDKIKAFTSKNIDFDTKFGAMETFKSLCGSIDRVNFYIIKTIAQQKLIASELDQLSLSYGHLESFAETIKETIDKLQNIDHSIFTSKYNSIHLMSGYVANIINGKSLIADDKKELCCYLLDILEMKNEIFTRAISITESMNQN